jgi:hypothetical protein
MAASIKGQENGGKGSGVVDAQTPLLLHTKLPSPSMVKLNHGCLVPVVVQPLFFLACLLLLLNFFLYSFFLLMPHGSQL